MVFRLKHNRGIGMAEIVIAVSIITVFLVAIVSAHALYLKTSLSNVYIIKSAFLIEEGIEAVKLLRDSSWTNNIATLTAGNTYYLTWNSATSLWQATTTNAYIDSAFERKFVLGNVYRNTSGAIVSSGGTLDTGTKQLTVSVSWKSGTATTTKSITTYITNVI